MCIGVARCREIYGHLSALQAGHVPRGLSAWAWCHARRGTQVMGQSLFICSQLKASARQGKFVHPDVPQNPLKSIDCGLLPFLLIVSDTRLTELPAFVTEL